MPDLFPTDTVLRALPSEIAAPYRRCTQSSLRPPADLSNEVARYLAAILERAQQDAFLDARTAERVAAGCSRLIELLEGGANGGAHAAVQAAVDYFLLEDDAEQDGSMIGFDDDLQVVRETFKALGWDDGGVLA